MNAVQARLLEGEALKARVEGKAAKKWLRGIASQRIIPQRDVSFCLAHPRARVGRDHKEVQGT